MQRITVREDVAADGYDKNRRVSVKNLLFFPVIWRIWYRIDLFAAILEEKFDRLVKVSKCSEKDFKWREKWKRKR